MGIQLDALPRKRRFLSRYKGSKYVPQINDLDRAIKQAVPYGMIDDVQLTIELVCGFEKYGHHETWAQGYRVSDGTITVESEWLDIAIARYADEKEKNKLSQLEQSSE